ncbi:hypothetical protein BA953_24775 (plasmid) [Vibrio coralliilyticus]|uniref:hypothetical protein n=1 Tax=Vibrio coralliilyticus TaxID=190893 RepID=UPI000810E8F0|nr:hypothetical protein [Vibrio coralliilyticus]ANW27411.1 hypothetical protein BA953_24775 [Vibrio coralliilyticus]
MTTQSYSFIDQQVERLTVDLLVLWSAVACGPNVDREVIAVLFPQGHDALEGLSQNLFLRQYSTHTYSFYHTAVYDYLQRHITPPVWKTSTKIDLRAKADVSATRSAVSLFGSARAISQSV